jgi:hypothetical protein
MFNILQPYISVCWYVTDQGQICKPICRPKGLPLSKPGFLSCDVLTRLLLQYSLPCSPQPAWAQYAFIGLSHERFKRLTHWGRTTLIWTSVDRGRCCSTMSPSTRMFRTISVLGGEKGPPCRFIFKEDEVVTVKWGSSQQPYLPISYLKYRIVLQMHDRCLAPIQVSSSLWILLMATEPCHPWISL